MKKGNIFIISAPSGAGKTTLCRRILELDDQIVFSVSHTTRTQRNGEADGIHYHFVSVADFMSMIDRGEFLEWAEVHGNFYGTSVASVQSEIEYGRDVILDIDVQGAAQIRRHFTDAVTIFIIPPSMQELEKRLRNRGTDSDEVIKTRLSNAEAEMNRITEYEYTVVNNDVARAVDDLYAILQSFRCKTSYVLAMNPWIVKMAAG